MLVFGWRFEKQYICSGTSIPKSPNAGLITAPTFLVSFRTPFEKHYIRSGTSMPKSPNADLITAPTFLES